MQRKNKDHLIFLLLAFFCFTVAQASANWPNEPAGATVISDWSFDNITGGGWNAPWGVGGKIVSDPTAPLSPSNVWRNTRSATGNDATGLMCALPAGRQDQVYFGFWFKPSNPHCGWFCWYQKVAIVNGAAPHIYLNMHDIDETAGTFTMVALEERAVKVYDTTNAHITPDGRLWPNVDGSRFQVGQWHRVEIYAKRSTSSTSRNGILMWWVDGVLRGRYTTMNFELLLTEVWLAQIWDSVDNTLPFTEYVQYDHVHVSIPSGEPQVVLPLSITTSSLPSPRTGIAYSATLQAANGKPAFAWTISAGALPAGLSLGASTGIISGTPTCVGRSDFVVKVTDASQPTLSATKPYTLVVSGSGCTSGIEESRESPFEGKREGQSQDMKVESRTGIVRFNLPEAGAYSLRVYDLTGREIWRNAGHGEAVWNHGGNLKRGVYLVRAVQNGRTMRTNYCSMW